MNDPIGDYFKKQEAVWDFRLPSGNPYILRFDGNSFSSLTAAGAGSQFCEKPFDERFRDCMVQATRKVLEYCSDAVLGYTQSDEISILLKPVTRAEAFLDGRIQKLVSLASGIVSVTFGRVWRGRMGREDTPIFDARVFTVTPDKIQEYFHWRQADAFKNCVSTVLYWTKRKEAGKKETCGSLLGVSTAQRIEMLHQFYGINMSDLPGWQRRGMVIRRISETLPIKEVLAGNPKVYEQQLAAGRIKEGQVVTREPWAVDYEPPRFHKEPAYIKNILDTHALRNAGKTKETHAS